jgi:hypothetical protein
MAHDPYASLRFPEFRAFLALTAAVQVATQVQSAVLGWQVYALTGDPLSLGLVGLAEALPFLSLTLVGGWAADRMDRRALSLASLAYGVAAGLGAAGLAALAATAPRPRPAAATGHVLEQLSDGVRFVFAQPVLLGAMSLDLFAVLFGGASALLPIFARDVLGVGEVGFGFLRAAPAAGSVLMSLLGGLRGRDDPAHRGRGGVAGAGPAAAGPDRGRRGARIGRGPWRGAARRHRRWTSPAARLRR